MTKLNGKARSARRDLSKVAAADFIAALMPAESIGVTNPKLGEVCTVVSVPWLPPNATERLWPPKAYDPGIRLGDELYLNWGTCKAVNYTPEHGRRAGISCIEPRVRNDTFHEQHLLMLDDVGSAKSVLALDDPRVLGATYVLETSKDNYQVGYKLDPPLNADQSAQLLAALKAHGLAKADLGDRGALTSPHRWCRVPGSVNTKPGRDGWRAQLRQWQPDTAFTLEGLCELLELDLDAAVKATESAPVEMPEDYTQYNDSRFKWMMTLPKGAPGSIMGPRRSTGFIPTMCPWVGEHDKGRANDGAAYRPGYGDEAPAFACKHSHGDKYKTAQFSDWALKQPSYIDFRKANGYDTADSDSRVDDDNKEQPVAAVDELPIVRFDVPPPPIPPAVIPHWLPRRVVTILGAHGGVGKSSTALEVAVSVALGSSVFGSPMFREGRVIYLSCEDDSSILRHRGDGYARVVGASPDELDGKLLCIDMTEAENVELFVEDPRLGTGHFTPQFERLKNSVRQHRPDLVIVDNASDVFAANENNRALVRSFMRGLKRLAQEFDCAVLLLVHTNKVTASAKAGEDVQGYSGSTAWHNSARSRWYMARDAEDRDLILLTLEKSNYGKSGLSVEIRWNEEKGLLLSGEPMVRQSLADLSTVILSKLVEYEGKGIELKAAPRTTGSAQGALRKDLAELRGHRATGVQEELEKLYRDGCLDKQTRQTKGSKNGRAVELFVVTDEGKDRIRRKARFAALMQGDAPVPSSVDAFESDFAEALGQYTHASRGRVGLLYTQALELAHKHGLTEAQLDEFLTKHDYAVTPERNSITPRRPR